MNVTHELHVPCGSISSLSSFSSSLRLRVNSGLLLIGSSLKKMVISVAHFQSLKTTYNCSLFATATDIFGESRVISSLISVSIGSLKSDFYRILFFGFE